MSVPCRHFQLRVAATTMYGTEEREQLRPCAEPMVHGIWIPFGIGTESLEKTVHRVIAHVEPAGWQQATILGEQSEHETKQDSNEATVNVRWFASGQPSQEFAADPLVGSLEAAQQFIQRVQNLLRQNFRDAGLIIATPLQQCGQSCIGWSGEKRP